MRNLRLPSIALLAISSSLLAQTVTVSNVSNGGTTGNVWRNGTNRVQCIYDSSLFTSQAVSAPIVITGITWFVGNGIVSTAGTYPSVDLFLQDASVDYASPTLTFSANRSDPLGVPNYSGPVTTLAQAATTPGLPMCSVTLTTPCVYVPQSGQDLIIEIVINAAPAPAAGQTTQTSFALGHLANTVRSVGAPAALTGGVSNFCPVVQLTYNTAITNTAQSLTIGQGCYNRPHSFYESWVDPNRAATVGLDIDPNTSGGTINGFDMINLGDQYYVIRNSVLGLPITPGSGATTLTLNNTAPTVTISATTNPMDDCYWTQPLPFAFPYPGNATGTTQIHIASNGAISLNAAPPAGSEYAFDQSGATGFAGFLARPMIAPNWMDLEPFDGVTSLGGQGNVIVDTDGSTFYSITWSGCQEWGYPTTLSTCQVVLTPTGIANVRYGSGGCNIIDCARLVGFSYGDGIDGGSGPSPRLNPDLSVATAPPGYVSGDGALNAILYAPFRPKVGRPFQVATTHFDAQAAFNFSLVSTTSLPGIDLGSLLNMPGCNAYILLPEVVSDFQLISGPTVTWTPLGSIPPSFAGFTVFCQAAQLLTGVPTPRNLANIVVSNGLSMTMEIN
jgi:hypothetical protein